MPFHPHKEAAALDMGPGGAPAAEYQAAQESEQELVRVINTLRELRSKFYMELDHVSARLGLTAHVRLFLSPCFCGVRVCWVCVL